MKYNSRPMRVAQAASKYGLPAYRIRKAIAEKQLTYIDIGTPRKKSYFLYDEDIQIWLDKLTGNESQDDQ